MTFDYLMAFYLLSRQLDKFAANMAFLDDHGYRQIPQHYEEAVMIYTSGTDKRIDLQGRKISADTIQRFEEFVGIQKMGGTRNQAWAALAPEFGRSYFFYYLFGFSGVTK